MRLNMKTALIVSGGNIHKDFALDFLKKYPEENVFTVAADRGLDFFMETIWIPYHNFSVSVIQASRPYAEIKVCSMTLVS